MKNETKTPQPTGLDILEALENGWEVYANGKSVDYVSTECILLAITGKVRVIKDVTGWLFIRKGPTTSHNWNAFYAKHCLSRPFVPEEWGWEPKYINLEEQKRSYQMRDNELYIDEQELSIQGPKGSLIFTGFPISARDYITLAEMLGIETAKTESV